MNYQQYKQLELRRKFFKLTGASITITDPSNNQQVGFIKMKAWKLKEDVRLYADSSQQQEVMRIQARSIIDFGATYDVFDSTTDQQLCSLRRKGLRSTFVRDHWLILDAAGNQTGFVQETSGTLALVRRWIGMVPFGDIAELVLAFTPQTYTINVGLEQQPTIVGQLTHRKNPFVVKMGLDTTMGQTIIDSRVSLAVASMLMIIDASKNN